MSLENDAKILIEKSAYDFYKSGAGNEFTLKLNKIAFNKIRIKPRILNGISKPDINLKLFNFKNELKCPIGISPMGMQKMAHPEGELATAKAAEEIGCIFIMSTVSTTSIEELAKYAPNTHKWFQLYIYKNRSLSKTLIRRAEAAGFEAIVLTVDTPVLGIRKVDIENNFELPSNLKLANFIGTELDEVKTEKGKSGISKYVSELFDPSISWEDLKWLVNFTKLPVIVKGILTVEDSLLAYHYGCKGIIVSNHGARQLDGVPASIEVLPEIVRAVGDKLTVMMDGGVTQGADVFKAIALGAKIVFIGRSIIWSLAIDGQKGVENVLNEIKSEFENTMIVCGCENLLKINSNMVVHESFYAKM